MPSPTDPTSATPSEPDDWYDEKSRALAQVLGREHDIVMHALLPFAFGGSLDLYYFPQPTGFAIATKELIDEEGTGPSNRTMRAYELVMFSRVPFDLSLAQKEYTPMGRIHQRLNGVLNATAMYACNADLNPPHPGETMEFPEGFTEDLSGQCIILDAYTPSGRKFTIKGQDFGLLLLINIHRSEMDHARKQGSQDLLRRLKEASVYPYSDLNRPAVV